MSGSSEKQYGLIIPGKQKKLLATAPILTKPSIFESDSDSDDSGGRPTGISVGLKRQDKEIQNKAIEEDPTIYQYDELYDEMEQKRKESKLSRKDLDKKPKYISNLLKAAEKRKLENERRIERQVQREREAEGSEFKDKEQFVTASYKEKLEEMRRQEELEKREEYLESIGDVTKQGNLDGFYRHLYEQKVNYNEDKEKKMAEIKETVKPDNSGENINEDNKEHDKKKLDQEELKKSDEKTEKKRHYRRKRSHSASEESEEENNVAKSQNHLPSNLDADSDFSIDSDSEGESSKSDGEPNAKKAKPAKSPPSAEDCKSAKGSESQEEIGPQNDGESKDKKVVHEQNGNLNGAAKEVKEKKPKIDIWKKRTVGAIFEAALQRYYERKALRSAR